MDNKQVKIHPLENKESLKARLIRLSTMEVHLPKVQLFVKIRRFISSRLFGLPKVPRERNYDISHADNPNVEAAFERHDIRRSVEAFTKRVWDAVKNVQTVDGSLRKRTLRTRSDEEIQRKQEEVNKRNLRLTHLSKTEGWKIDVINMLRQWENFCYMNLRFPESRKDKVSLDYFLGFQNGSLWIIESFRKEIYNSATNLKRQNAIHNKESGK